MAWSKRKKSIFQREKTALGGCHVQNAKAKLHSLALSAVSASIDFPYKMEEVLPWIFSQEDRDICRAAYGVAEDPSFGNSYTLTKHTDAYIQFREQRMLPIESSRVTHCEGGSPLLDVCATIEQISLDFGVATYVVNWLDKHATIGAIRYYFPTLLSLASECDKLMEATPGMAFREPMGVSRILPLIRRASTTVAAALMLPTPEHKSGNFRITAACNATVDDVSVAGVTLTVTLI